MYTAIATLLPVLLFASTSAMPTPYKASVGRALAASGIVARVPSASYEGSIAKRIAQDDLVATAEEWQKLCQAGTGGDFSKDPCVQLAGQKGIDALLGAADPCEQQDVADAMVDFAKSGAVNKKDLIAFAVKYRKHPRNAIVLAGGGKPPSSPFCQKAPKNPELKGVSNKQLDGVDPDKFGGPKFPVIKFGEKGSCPFGKKANLSKHTCE